MHVHEQIVDKVMEVMPEGETLQNLAEFFRVFGDSTRIRILYALSQSELCVCDIASLLGMGQSAISHQLFNSCRYSRRRKKCFLRNCF